MEELPFLPNLRNCDILSGKSNVGSCMEYKSSKWGKRRNYENIEM